MRMEHIVKFAEGFTHLFQLGADTFISWMTSIVPLVLILLVAMNTITSLIGEKRMDSIAKASSKNPFLRYLLLPFIGSFMLASPMSLTLGKFLPEKYKPGFYSSITIILHTSNGLFPHVNPGELFVFLGIANGITQLGFSTTDLAIRYLIVGAFLGMMNGVICDFVISRLCKAEGVELSSEVEITG